ncbi:MAG TPA: type II secretion system protein [Ilumatobacteraceae bacterium]|nr:type II secretion system protein [Ilumatobacteraceae bacterium]
MNNSSIIQDQIDGEQDDKGFTLIEILIAIVLVGILSAVAVVGISNLVSKGSSASCNATGDSAKAASAVYFAANANSYPTTFTALTTAGSTGAALTLPSGVAINTGTTDSNPTTVVAGMQLHSGTSWYLTMTAGSGTAAPTFVCTP